MVEYSKLLRIWWVSIALVTSLGTVLTTYWSVLLPVLLLCVFVLQAYGFSFPSALPLPLFLKESIQPLVVARSAAHASPISRQGSEAVIRAFPKISSATNAKIPFPKLPFSLKACLILGDSTQNSLQWLIYSMESSRTRKKWRRGNIWRFLGCWSCPSSRAKYAQNHVKLMACVSPPHFILTYIKYRKTLQPFNLWVLFCVQEASPSLDQKCWAFSRVQS